MQTEEHGFPSPSELLPLPVGALGHSYKHVLCSAFMPLLSPSLIYHKSMGGGVEPAAK